MRASAGAVPGLRSTGSKVVDQGLSFSEACGIFPDQGSNPCLLHWQADSLPLRHQGSPLVVVLIYISLIIINVKHFFQMPVGHLYVFGEARI